MTARCGDSQSLAHMRTQSQRQAISRGSYLSYGTAARHWNLVSRKAIGSAHWSVLFIGMQQSQSLFSVVSQQSFHSSLGPRLTHLRCRSPPASPPCTTNTRGYGQPKILSTSESESSISEIKVIEELSSSAKQASKLSAELSGNKIQLMFMKQKICRLKEDNSSLVAHCW